MSLTNQELLVRLDAAIKNITDVTAMGLSVLQPEKQERFVRAMQARANVLSEARYMRMDSPIEDIDRVGFMSRILRAGTNAGGVHRQLQPGQNPAEFAAPITGTERLVARELQAVAALRDSALRRNIERGNFENTLIDLFGEAAGRDMEEYALLANSNVPWAIDDVLSLTDGWIELAGSQVYGNYTDTIAGAAGALAGATAAGSQDIILGAGQGAAWAPGDVLRIGGRDAFQEYFTVVLRNVDTLTLSGITKHDHAQATVVRQIDAAPHFNPLAIDFPDNMFQAALEALPKRFFQNSSEWRMWVDWDTEDKYRNLLRRRQTALGDSATTDAQDLKFKGIPIVYAPMLERSQAYNALNNTWGRVGLFSHPDNMVWGVFHEVTIERDRIPKDRRTDFVLTLEGDSGYEDHHGAVAMFIDAPAVP